MKVIYFDCFSGISGDMILGAFLDAGLDIGILRDKLSKLRLGKFEIKKRKTKRNEIVGTKFEVNTSIPSKTDKRNAVSPHTSLKKITALINRSGLEEDVKELSNKIFQNLAKSESKIHGMKSENVYFDEIGDVDSIIDIVGASIGIKEFGIEKAYSSILRLGTGYVKCRDGVFPVPAPASLDLLKYRTISLSDIPYELTTPTGAAIVKTICENSVEMPNIQISKIGYGVGRRRIDAIPNLLRIIIGHTPAHYMTDTIMVVETTIDDMNSLGYEPLFERLFRAGALDVYIVPAQMKKSRPAVLLTVLSEVELLDRIISILFDETTTFGIRYYQVNRKKLYREFSEVKTKYGKIKIKIGKLDETIKTVSPEYDDCKQIAKRKNIPFRIVYNEAMKNCKSLQP